MNLDTRLRSFLFAFAVSIVTTTLSAQGGILEAAPKFLRGDTNADGQADLSDGVALLGCLFLGDDCPTCPDSADANDDGRLELSDSIFLFNWLFLGGAEPPSPGAETCGADPTRDSLGRCIYETSTCGDSSDPDPDPKRADMASWIHFAARTDHDEHHDHVEDDVHLGTGEQNPRDDRRLHLEVRYEPRPETPAWNSLDGRAILEHRFGRVGIDHAWARIRPEGSIEDLVTPTADPSCTRARYWEPTEYLSYDDWAGGQMVLMTPNLAFNTSSEARSFLMKIHAEMPFFLPFSDPDVRLGQGWFYENGNGHRGQDYSRTDVPEDTDATFEVRSAADGQVVHVTYNAGGGNTVFIVHTAPGGQQVMTAYMHLRNGRTNDINQALALTSNSTACRKYRLFARDYSDHISWGTEDQTIQVRRGDFVRAGQLIGWAGNTGCGGAGAGLESDGSPRSFRGNIHLHTYWAVPHPSWARNWVYVDPYGVYNQVGTGCYDLLKDTNFSRLLAPFFPTFHGIPYEVFAYYWGYYGNMNWSPRTLSFHRRGDQVLVSGSFERGIPGAWRFATLLTIEDFDRLNNRYADQGFVARETTTVRTVDNRLRFNAIWRPRAGRENFDHRIYMSDREWAQRWSRWVGEARWRVQDFFSYLDGGIVRQIGLFTSSGSSTFALFRHRTSDDMDNIVNQERPGLILDQFSVSEFGNTYRYNAIFQRNTNNGCWRVHWARNGAQHQQIAERNIRDGFRLHRIQGYRDSTRYASVWHAVCRQ